MKQSSKAPVFLTAAKVEMVHEPNEGDGCIPVDMSRHKVLKDTFPEPQSRWDGGWYGDEESRLAYLKMHGKLWGFCRPEQCVNAKRTRFLYRRRMDGFGKS